jgi:hypothetical protein
VDKAVENMVALCAAAVGELWMVAVDAAGTCGLYVIKLFKTYSYTGIV